jgi:hypothetical protein
MTKKRKASDREAEIAEAVATAARQQRKVVAQVLCGLDPT